MSHVPVRSAPDVFETTKHFGKHGDVARRDVGEPWLLWLRGAVRIYATLRPASKNANRARKRNARKCDYGYCGIVRAPFSRGRLCAST